MEALMIHLRRV